MMKKKNSNQWTLIKLVLFVPVILVLLQAFALPTFKSDKSKINGTYRIVSEEIITNGESTFNIKNDKDSGLKTWSDKNFMFVSSNINGSQITNYFGGGTYALSGNEYTENIQYHSAPNYRGVSLKLHLEMKGDTVIQIWPCDKDFKYDKNNCVVHKYVRVD